VKLAKEKDQYDFSVVVPVYNEIRRLRKGLDEMRAYLATRRDRCQLIVVDDGSTDGTADLAEKILNGDPNATVIRNPINRGKGHAVKIGMLAARGRARLFTDIDLSVPIETADEFVPLILDGADVVIGTRKVQASQVMVHQPYYREVLGGFFRFASRAFFAPPVTDFTCGFKVFSAHATRAVFSQSLIERWSFDTEVLFLAYRMGFRMVQVPVMWFDSADTRVDLFLDMWRSLKELFEIRRHAFMGRYIFAKSYQGTPDQKTA
jgi:dolichyl-phosphate beta-glucosyltransferase